MMTLTSTAARKGLFELLKKTNDQHEVYHIHHRSGENTRRGVRTPAYWESPI